MQIPTPRTPGTYRIALVCLGNICRSPMADVVLNQRAADAGLSDAVEIRSAGTAGWHAGKAMDPRAAELLTSEGYDANRHRARQVPVEWLTELDLVLAMDNDNLRDLTDLGGSTPDASGRLHLFRDFDPEGPGGEVPDPYYGGPSGFRDVLAMVERTSETLVEQVAAALGS